MLVLHHCVSARSFRPLWMLEEVGLKYQLQMLPFPPRMLAKTFLKENPLGTVPLLVHGNVRLTESAAMCQYIASLHKDKETTFDMGADDPYYGPYLNWLHMSDATLTFPQTLMLRYTHFEPPERRHPQIVEDYSKWFLARLRAVDSTVQHSEFLCGRFTAADVAVGYSLMLAGHLGLTQRFSPAVAAYWLRLQSRPAYVRSLAIQHTAARAKGISTTPAPDTRPYSV